MDGLNIHNVVDIEIQEVRRAKSGNTIWRTIEITSEDGHKTGITLFSNGRAGDLFLRNQ